MPTLAGNKHLSIHFFPHRTCLFYLSMENGGPNLSEMNIKVLVPAPTSHFTNTALFLNWKMEKQMVKYQGNSWSISSFYRKLRK